MNEPILTKSRQVKHCPPHFVKVPIETARYRRMSLQALDESGRYRESIIRDWLHQNVVNRFYIGQTSELENTIIVESTIAAFEDPHDATLFVLSLPSIIE